MTREELVKKLHNLNVFTSKGKMNPQTSKIIAKDPFLKQAVIDATCFLASDEQMRVRVFCIQHDIRELPKCKVCNRDMSFNHQLKRFNVYCPNTSGRSCAAEDGDLFQKRQRSLVATYGDRPFSNKDIVGKRKATMMDRYGVDSAMKSKAIRERTANTIMERYGVDRIADIPGVSTKRSTTNLLKYGSETYAESLVPQHARESLGDLEWLDSRLRDYTIVEIAEELETTPYTVRQYVKLHGLEYSIGARTSSSSHREIMRLLDSHGVTYHTNYKKLIAPKEVDLYIPSANLAIEFNGVFFHSELSGRDKRYHLDKTENCEIAGVRLIHVWSTEWALQKDIVTSRILNSIGVGTSKIYARKCEIVELSKSQEKAFFNSHHIQGYRPSTVCLGLQQDGAIVAACSFIRSRFDKTIEWELLRYANAKSTHVVGGGSRLFKAFVNLYKPTSVISYCDRRWGSGGLYEKLGFEYQHSSSPNYFYFKRNGDTNKLMSRQNFQKHKLNDVLDAFDPTLSEWENMKMNGYDRIWDCGNKVFLWKPT
jgi:hypothetical protein